MRFTLYPIHRLSAEWEDDPFRLGQLPLDVAESVRIEDVSERFTPGAFDLWTEMVGTRVVEELKAVQFALVHRYDPEPVINPENGEVLGERQFSESSKKLIEQLAACLRLIRPMRQYALSICGHIHDDDGSFEVQGFDVLPHMVEVPDVQKLFSLRNRDAEDLRALAPEFLRAMRGEFWKFRMAVQFHDLGHFQTLDWKARYLLWCSVIESIYTSHNWEHQGSLVATSRIKWFIGENTSIYAPGDIPNTVEDPGIKVGQIVGDLYEMRNFMAHGDKIPDPFFTVIMRHGLNDEIRKRQVLLEAVSFLIRSSLLKILRNGLLEHFAGAGPAEAYFSAAGLTKSALRAPRP